VTADKSGRVASMTEFDLRLDRLPKVIAGKGKFRMYKE
jgi:hypothetical protein